MPLPGRQHRDRRKESCQDDQKQADAVHAEVIINSWRVDPIGNFFKLVARDARAHRTQQKHIENTNSTRETSSARRRIQM